MVQLDVIFARAALAMDMNATEPIFNDEGRIRLKQARHPLIDKKKAVPLTSVWGKISTCWLLLVLIPAVKLYP